MKNAEPKQLLRRIAFCLTLAALIIALLFSLIDTMIFKRIYLFSEEFWMDVVTRFQGPGRMRFVFQPLLGVLMGIAHGRRHPHQKVGAVQSAAQRWRNVMHALSVPLMMGIVLDVIFQLILFQNVHIVPAIIIGPLFVSAPYIIANAIASRLSHRRMAHE